MEVTGARRTAKNRIIDLPQYRNRTRIFHNRLEAADALAELLPARLINTNPVLLAISGAGYMMATELADRFDLDVEYIPVQSIMLPWDGDRDYAAVAFDGSVYLDESMISRNHLGQKEIDKGIERALTSMRRESVLINSVWLQRIRNRNLMLIDEGIVTNVTVRTALQALETYSDNRPSLAVATGYDRALLELSPWLQQVFCANVRSGYTYSIADVYRQLVSPSTSNQHTVIKKGKAAPATQVTA
jgi:predicted phosphoribosyltransferase